MTFTVRGVARRGLWIGLYVVLVLFPVPWIAMGRSTVDALPDQLGAILGYVALSMLALQFVLTARFEILTPPFGTDVLYAFHRGTAVVALLFALAHPVLMLPASEIGGWLDPVGAHWAGAVALYLLLLLVVLSAVRDDDLPAQRHFSKPCDLDELLDTVWEFTGGP